MYYFTTAIVVDKKGHSGYVYKDISQETMRAIYDNYRKVFIKIQRTGQTFRWVNMQDIWTGTQNPNWTQTLEMWLMAYPPSLQLPGATTYPIITNHKAIFNDAFRAGYDIQRVSDTGHPSNDVPSDMRKDLLLSRFATDYQLLNNNVVVTVNGLLHPSINDTTYGLRVFKGGESVLHSGKNLIGLYSFRALGGITQVPINDGDISSTGGNFTSGFYINLNRDLRGKTLLLSIGGYLHYPDDVYKVVNAETGLVKIYPPKINIFGRLFESRSLINLESLPLVGHPQDHNAINPLEVWTEAFWRAYFTIPQTFALVVNGSDTYLNRIALDKAQLDGVCYSYVEPIFPIMLGTNRIREYWVRQEEEIYAVSMESIDRNYYQYSTTNYGTSTWIIPNRISCDPNNYGLPEFVEFGSQTIQWSIVPI